MTRFIETKISEIENLDFKTFVADVCRCFGWRDPHEFENKNLASLFGSSVASGKIPNLRLILGDTILSVKVKDLDSNSIVYKVCVELIGRNSRLAMDDMRGVSVFTVVKKCYKVINPSVSRPKRLTALEESRATDTAIILQRRRSGTL